MTYFQPIDAHADPADRSSQMADWFAGAHARLRAFAAAAADLDMDPDDVLQTALERSIRAGLLTSVERPEPYVRKAIMTTVLNARRAAARHGAAARREGAVVEQQDAYPSDVGAVLEILQPVDRALLYLVDIEGYTTSDAADIVGSSATAVRSRLSRSRAVLRDHLNASAGGDDDV